MHDIIPPKPGYGQIPDDMLRLVSYCPVCHYHYNPMQARILDENDVAQLMYIKCHKCKSAIVALIMSNSVGISSVGLITDLDGQEMIRFKNSQVINDNDVLAAYSALQSNQLEKIVL